MKRGGNLKRSPLKADPATIAAFVQRGRGQLRRVDFAATNPPPRKTTLPGARGWTQRVFALYGNRCVACGKRAAHGHHTVALRTILDAHRLTVDVRAALAFDARNGCPVCAQCHMDHEAAANRIPFDKLPPGAVQWAIEHGFRSRVMDRRVYPLTGDRR